MMRGVDPSGKSVIAAETTSQDEGGQTQPYSGALEPRYDFLPLIVCFALIAYIRDNAPLFR